ncbi:MAG: tripartite tricarboxylate transporter permease [Spirochaetales bacterium]|jgi:putative tricarboxylic transport membrane protein|nr:tripartite tricarboxylate transporter permease [Spirochaetales bacterium]
MITSQLLANLFNLQTLIGLLVGVVGGMFIGALPGLGATMGIALLIPITFGMQPTAALIMLTALYTSAIYGGSITAILIHTPGTPASAATAMDGYALTQQGRGLQAVGISTCASMTGGTLSAVALLFIAPPLARVSLMFNAPEYFLIAIFGLTIIGSLAGDNMLKGLIAGVAGLCISFIGFDITVGVARFTYKISELESGIQLVPALIGLFSLSQVMIQAESIEAIRRGEKTEINAQLEGRILPTLKEFIAALPNLIRSSIIGIFVGILPGAGGDIGGWLGYNEAKRWSKNKALFGKGATEAIWASESANNAVTGGALIPLITLGIPGSSAAAVLLGGLLIQGLTSGHTMFSDAANTTYAIILGFMFANILMGIIGFLIARKVAKVANAPTGILAPIIVVLSVVGAYAINLSYFDACVMVAFGLVGYFMRKTGFATAPVVLAIILGSMAEQGFKRAILMAKDESMLTYYLSRPICVVLILLIVLSLFAPLGLKALERRMAKIDTGADKDSDD